MESKKKKKMIMKNLGQDGNKDLLENGLEDTGRGKGKLGQSERVVVYIWTYMHYQMWDG